MRALIFVFILKVSFASPKCEKLVNCESCNNYEEESLQICEWCVPKSGCKPKGAFHCNYGFGDRITQVEDCPRPIEPQFLYNESFARDIMLPLAGAAYNDDPQTCFTKRFNGTQLLKKVEVRCDSGKSTTCSGYIAVSPKLEAIILSFRGTSGSEQLLLEVLGTLSGYVPIIGSGKASEYFFNAYNAVWEGGLKDAFLQAKENYPGYELWITGHSLGGAMASIASNMIATLRLYDPQLIKFVTFGQPRTGDHYFAAAHDSMLPYSYRLTNAHDPVPHLPLRKVYHHHRYEVFYRNGSGNDDNHKICFTPDDDFCSNSNGLDLSIEDHLNYFGVQVSMSCI